MNIWGLHVIDVFIILLYVAVILWLGKRVAHKARGTEEFFLAGRKLGEFYQFFLNFGCSTNADQAVAVSREIYRQGIGGMWIQFLVLFLTPFYWFTTMLFRRVRLVTIGDYFTVTVSLPVGHAALHLGRNGQVVADLACQLQKGGSRGSRPSGNLTEHGFQPDKGRMSDFVGKMLMQPLPVVIQIERKRD